MAKCDHPGAECIMGMNFWVCRDPRCPNGPAPQQREQPRPTTASTHGFIPNVLARQLVLGVNAFPYVCLVVEPLGTKGAKKVTAPGYVLGWGYPSDECDALTSLQIPADGDTCGYGIHWKRV